MVKTPTNGQEIEKPADLPNDSIWTKPNLNGDWCNIILLTILYTIQGILLGFSMIGLPMIIQNKNLVTYNDQGSISYILWPYSIKLLWAPMVDSFYIRRIGRRKTWLIPVQYLIGSLLLYIANNLDEWLPESGKPNLKMIVYFMFVINMLNTTQDIIVDGWALTMLKKNNVSYASTCNYTGVSIGIFIGAICTILLLSEEFCNKYLRYTLGTGGIISIKSIVTIWGVLFLLITTLVAIFKKEKDTRLEHAKINIIQSYEIIWSILKLPSMRVFAIAVLTSMIGFSAMDMVMRLKLIDAGVPKDDLVLITSVLITLNIFLPILMSKYTAGLKPLSLFLKCVPIRLLWGVPFVMLKYYTPFLIKNNGVVNVPLYYYFIIGFILTINEVLNNIMLMQILAFFIKISDPRFGGTYLAFLNTVRMLSVVIPNTINLKMVDILTFTKCSNDGDRDDFSNFFQNIFNAKNGQNCVIILDGYYVEAAICLVIGFVWYFIFKSRLKSLQSKNLSYWMVDLNSPI